MSDMKSAWSPGPISHSQASLSHELWKVPQGPRSSVAPSRPPPGLTNSKPAPSSAWGSNSLGLAQGWSSSYTSGGSPMSPGPSGTLSCPIMRRDRVPGIHHSGGLLTRHFSETQSETINTTSVAYTLSVCGRVQEVHAYTSDVSKCN